MAYEPCRAGAQARAKVAELVDALDLGSSGATRESSSLSFRTTCNWQETGDQVYRAPRLFQSVFDGLNKRRRRWRYFACKFLLNRVRV